MNAWHVAWTWVLTLAFIWTWVLTLAFIWQTANKGAERERAETCEMALAYERRDEP